MDMFKFPFDTQQCSLDFGNVLELINITAGQKTIDLRSFYSSNEFDVSSDKIERVVYKVCLKSMMCLQLRRVRLFTIIYCEQLVFEFRLYNSFGNRLAVLTVNSSWIVGHAWWRHQMGTLSVLLALCTGNSPVTGEFPSQRPVTRSVKVFFDLRLNKRFSKQSWGWWFETPSRSSWRHCNAWCETLNPDYVIYLQTEDVFNHTDIEIHFNINLKRKPLYYVMNIIIPTAVLALLSAMTFVVPAETGERLALGVTILLAFSVFMLILSDNTTQASDNPPALGE